MIEDVDWLEKYNTICDKASADIKMKFGSDPVCKKNFENQNKSHGNEFTDFYDKKIKS